LELALLSPDQKEAIIQDARLDDKYMPICQAVPKKENVDANYSLQGDLLAWKGRIYVPKVMRKKVMKSEHDSEIAGHFCRDRTMELISRNFFWPKMEDEVRQYCNECNNCQRTMSPRHAKHGLLHPLELPSKPGIHISTDFITDLPESSRHTKIFVVVDMFTKMPHFITLSKKDSPTVARAYLENVWKYHRFLEDVVSDRDGTFTGQYLPDLSIYLGIKRSMSTAFHPQTDGQTERINQVIEAYLRSYCNYEQNDWAEMLGMAEFEYNNSKNSATKMSPLYANYRYEPRTNWPTDILFRNPASEMYGHYMTSIHEKFSAQFGVARSSMAKYYDRKRRSIELFKKEELFMLNGKNIQSKGRCKKLDDKMYGPFKILTVGHNNRYCKLELPPTWKIHLMFNISRLERYRRKNPDMGVIELEADDAGWTIEKVIASGRSNDDVSNHVFLIKWKDYRHKENAWEKFDNVMENAEELLKDYYEENLNVEKDKRFGKEKTRRKDAEGARKRKSRQRRKVYVFTWY
jgi:hypothetical protein